jgi:N-hydroxyarylamine O-acetyltransferase
MNTNQYLKRINFTQNVDVNNQTLIALHEHHVYSVPFENLDIHYKKIFDLNPDRVYKKVVGDFRGGFCYELNLIFSRLLIDIGFTARIISCRIFNDSGEPGPEYDHMAIHVKTDREYLVDVGFGDLFVRPLEIRTGIQYDGRNHFKIEMVQEKTHLLSMSADGINFQKKYIFSLEEVYPESFASSCLDKQTNPNSYFVKNTVCTLPTKTGRTTIFNNKFIQKENNAKTETLITDDLTLRELLINNFKIVIQ